MLAARLNEEMSVMPPSPMRPARGRLWLALMWVGLLGARTVEAQPVTRAEQISHDGQLLAGPEASGQIGDYKISNAHLVAVITAPRAGKSGGLLVDLTAAGGQDSLGQIAPSFDPAGRRQPRLDRVEITQAGGRGSAIIHTEGVDSLDEQVKVSVDYVLEPDARYLRVITTVRHRGRSHYQDFALGRLILWGDLTPFAPGAGMDPVGLRARSPWIGGESPEASLVLSPFDGLIESFHGRGWTVTRETEPYLRPGATHTLESWIWVSAEGGVARPVARLHAYRKTVVGQIEGLVRDDEGPISGARISFIDANRASAHHVRTGPDGRFTITLPPGKYSGEARAAGRAPGNTRWFRVVAGNRAGLDIELGKPGAFKVKITDEGGRPLAARVTLTPKKGTPPLDLHAGDAPRVVEGVAALDDQLYLEAGQGQWPLAPGTYEATIMAGPAYAVAREIIKIAPGEIATLEVSLAKQMSTGGWWAVDPRVHTRQTVASAISTSVRQLGCRTQGVDVAITADHLAAPVGRRGVTMLPGYFSEADEWGWFGAVPLDGLLEAPPWPLQSPPRPDERLRALNALPGDPLVVVFDPRNPRTGYFSHFAFEPAVEALPRGGFSLDFDLLEIAAGALQARLDVVRADVHGLVARGATARPVAASGITGMGRAPCGLPRTWIMGTGNPDRAQVAQRLAEGPMVASFGPLIDVVETRNAKGHQVDIKVQAPGWHLPNRMRIWVDGALHRKVKLRRRPGRPMAARHSVQLEGQRRRAVVVEVDGPAGAREIYGIGVRPYAIAAPIFVGGDTP